MYSLCVLRCVMKDWTKHRKSSNQFSRRLSVILHKSVEHIIEINLACFKLQKLINVYFWRFCANTKLPTQEVLWSWLEIGRWRLKKPWRQHWTSYYLIMNRLVPWTLLTKILFLNCRNIYKDIWTCESVSSLSSLFGLDSTFIRSFAYVYQTFST